MNQNDTQNKNILGEPLKPCCADPVTGFYRDGVCRTGVQDRGTHVVCAQVTNAFLQYSKLHGNDLTQSHPEFGFVGLKAGDYWCLCAMRWFEALGAGVAPPIDLNATDERMLDFVSIDILQTYALGKT